MVEQSPTHKNFSVDRALIGSTQVPAEKFSDISGDSDGGKRIARRRRLVAAGAGMEISGRAMAVAGLESSRTTVFVAGSLLAMAGMQAQRMLTNRIGGEWSMALQEKVDSLGAYKGPVNAALINNGIAAEEAEAIGTLPFEVYTTEFFNSQQTHLRNIINPLVLAGVTTGFEDYKTSALLLIAGAAYFPISNKIHERDKMRSAKVRAGRSSRSREYIKRTFEEHYRNTDSTNAASHIPESLATSLIATGKAVANISTLYAFRLLGGYNELMGDQRNRDASGRTTEIATKFIDTTSNEPFITEERWKEHVDTTGIDLFSPAPFYDGVVIEDFIAKSPTGESTKLSPLNLEIPAGGAAILQAESGKGKSLTLMALMHLFEHRGSVRIIENSVGLDVHLLDGQEELAEKFLYITEATLNKSARIADLFKDSFMVLEDDLYQEQQKKHDPLNVEVAWTMADNLLESEIMKIEENKPSIFPEIMHEDLKMLWTKRKTWIEDYLKEQGGNLTSITADRVFDTLSDGEKRRMIAEIAYWASKTKKRNLIILDEPLAGLDKGDTADKELHIENLLSFLELKMQTQDAITLEELLVGLDIDTSDSESQNTSNKELQIRTLRRMQDENNAALLLVSHDNIEELQERLNNCSLVTLEQKSDDK